MKQITVKELMELCKHEIDNGNGNKNIVISDDNEGNGFHGLFCGFTELGANEWCDLIYDSTTSDDKDTIMLG